MFIDLKFGNEVSQPGPTMGINLKAGAFQSAPLLPDQCRQIGFPDDIGQADLVSL